MFTLNKYVIKSSVFPFLLGIGGFIIFSSIQMLYYLSETIVANRVSISVLFEMIFYYLPDFAVKGIPVGVLLSIFWFLSQLGSKSELMALQVHGVSFKKIVLPFLLLGLMYSGIAYWLSDYVVPDFNEKAESTLYKVILKQPEVTVKTNQFFNVGNNKYFYVKEFDRESEKFEDVLIYDIDGSDIRVFHAKTAERDSETKEWILKNGRVYTLDYRGLMKLDYTFEETNIDISKGIDDYIFSTAKKAQFMTSKDIIAQMEQFDKMGTSRDPLEVELHTRFANSLAPLIIAFVGVPLSLTFNIKSKSWSVIFTFGLIVLYQGSGAWLAAMGKQGIINPTLSAWISDGIFFSVGLILFIFLDTKIMYRFKETISRLLSISSVFSVLAVMLFFFSVTGMSEGTVTVNESAGNYSPAEDEVIIDITADNYSISNDGKEIVLEGNVRVNYESIVITAPKVTAYFAEDNYIEYFLAESDATETVHIVKEKENFQTRLLKAYLKKNSYFMYNLRGTYNSKNKKGSSQELIISSEKSRMKSIDGSDITEIHSGYITTCDYEKPHYRFQANYIVIKDSDEMIAYDLVMYIFDIPVLPYPIFFTSLGSSVQPVESSFSYGGDSGFKTHLRFNYLQKKDESGAVFLDTTEKGSAKGTTIGIENKFKIDDSVKGYLYAKQNTSEGFENRRNDLKFNISKDINESLNVYYYYESMRIIENSNEKARTSLTGLRIKGPFLNRSFMLEMNRKESRSNGKGSNSYTFPSFSVSGLSATIFEENYPITVSAPSFSFVGSTVTPIASSVLEVYDSLKYQARFGLNTTFSPLKVLDTVLVDKMLNTWKFSADIFDDEVKQDFIMDNTIPFHRIGFDLDKFLSFSTGYTINAGFMNDKNGNFGWRYAESVKTKLSINFTDYWKNNLTHDFLFVKGDNSARFSNNREKNALSYDSIWAFPFVFTNISLSTSYDFKKKKDNFTDPVVKSDTAFELFDVDYFFKTKTIYSVQSNDFKNTLYDLGFNGDIFDYSLSFLYDYTKDDSPVDKFVNKSNITLKDIDQIKTLTNTTEFTIEKENDSWEAKTIRNKLNATTDNFSLSFDLYYSKPTLNLQFKGKFEGIDVTFGTDYDTKNSEFKKFQLGLVKDLHCWMNETSVSFINSNEGFELDKITTKFYIKAFPEKFVSVDPKAKSFDFSIF